MLRDLLSFFILFSLDPSAAVIENDKQLIVALKNPPNSLVRGHILKTDLGNNIFAYQDIPYAEPPIGKRRFQKPVMSKGWKGILDATQSKKLCLQPPSFLHPKQLNYTEDCLVISVYSPGRPNTSKKYPVMVWIHGGGFMIGGGNLEIFHPKYFIDEKIVMVTLNYRLGPFGFLTTGDKAIPANNGLYDQELAIKWVHENIKDFGGDSMNVVIAGESAGAGSVGWQLIGSQRSTDYYDAAIISSGAASSPFALSINVYEGALELVQTIDPSFKADSSTEIRNFLQRIAANDILNALINVTHTYVPTLEPDGKYSKAQTDAYDYGHTKRVPLLVSFMSEEYLIFFASEEDAKKEAAAKDNSCLLNDNYNILEENREQACLTLKRLYTKGNFSDDIPAFVSFSTDNFFMRGILRNTQSYSKYVSDVYLYQLSYNPSTYPKVPIKGVVGVPHGADIDLLFDSFGVSVNFTKTDNLVSRRLTRMWANFIKYRNPTPRPEALLQNTQLPKVTPDTLWYLNVTSNNMTISTNPRDYDRWGRALDPFLFHPITVI